MPTVNMVLEPKLLHFTSLDPAIILYPTDPSPLTLLSDKSSRVYDMTPLECDSESRSLSISEDKSMWQRI